MRLRVAYRNDLTEEQLGILVNERDSMNIIAHLALRGISFAGTNEAILEPLLFHRRPSLRAFAASAEQLTDGQVRKLMHDDAAQVRLALCTNPILTHAALEELAKDWNTAVAETAIQQLKTAKEENRRAALLLRNSRKSKGWSRAS